MPPNLGYHMGRCLIAMLNKKPDLKTMDVVEENGSTSLVGQISLL